MGLDRALAFEENAGEFLMALGSGFGEGPVEAEWVGEMYRRLGFVEYCRISLYEWHPG